MAAHSRDRRCEVLARHLRPSGASSSDDLVASRREGHKVPAYLSKIRGSAVVFMENGARRPSHAEKAKSLAARSGSAFLATMHQELRHPYGSVVNVALDRAGRPFTFLSRMAEHTANLRAEPRCSVLVSEVQGGGGGADQLATARLTMVGTMREVLPRDGGGDEDGGEKEGGEYQRRFLLAHPGAFYVEFEDFLCFRLEISAVRFIGGFGEMSWVTPAAFLAAEADAVANGSAGAVAHMNADHADAVLLMARTFGGVGGARSATILALDKYGFDVLAEMTDGKRRTRVSFDPPLESAGDSIRQRVVSMTEEARTKLGITSASASASAGADASARVSANNGHER